MVLWSMRGMALIGWVLCSWTMIENAWAQPVTAVMIVDMQEGYMPGRGLLTASRQLKALLQSQLHLLQHAEQMDWPIVVVGREGEGETIEDLRNVVRARSPDRYAFVEKRRNGVFEQPNEAFEVLQKWNVKRLIVTGINGPYCIRKTVLGAWEEERDYEVITSADLVANFTDALQRPEYPDSSWWHHIPPAEARFRTFKKLDEMLRCPDIFTGP